MSRMMNGPRSVPLHKQANSDGGNIFPKRQPNLSLPCIPSEVDHWFSAELEKRGINQIIYGPTVITLLIRQRRAAANVSVADRYSARMRAIEILMEATNGGHSTDDISNLVDEVDLRLRQSEPAPARASNPCLVGSAPAGPDEGFLEWGAGQSLAPPDRAEEEGELLLSEVSDMLQKFNMEVRHGALREQQQQQPAEPAPAPKEGQVGIPAARKRDESIDSGCGSFNWGSRDCSNESSPPSALDWLSVSPGGGSIWSTSPAPGPALPAAGQLGAELPWAYAPPAQFRARMRLTSAPSVCFVDEEAPEVSRVRVLSTSHASPGPGPKKKKTGKAGKAHAGRQASPPSDSGSSASAPGSGGCSPPAGAPASPSMTAGKSSLEKSRRACSFYLRGHCKKEDCEFAHDLTKVTCKFWMTGECFKGDTCPFLHGQLSA